MHFFLKNPKTRVRLFYVFNKKIDENFSCIQPITDSSLKFGLLFA
jgi:hypothetical protein